MKLTPEIIEKLRQNRSFDGLTTVSTPHYGCYDPECKTCGWVWEQYYKEDKKKDKI